MIDLPPPPAPYSQFAIAPQVKVAAPPDCKPGSGNWPWCLWGLVSDPAIFHGDGYRLSAISYLEFGVSGAEVLFDGVWTAPEQ